MSVSVDNPVAVEDIANTDLEWCFNPLMTLLDLAGMHMPMKRRKAFNALSIGYSVCFYVCLCLGNTRFFLFTRGTDTVGKWTTLLSYCGFQVTCSYFTFATCFSINRHLPKLFKEFDSYRKSYGSATDNAKIRRIVKILLCLLLCHSCIIQAFIYMTTFYNVNPKAIHLSPLGSIQEDYHLIFKTVYNVWLWLCILQMTAILTFFVIFTYCLSKEYSRTNSQIKHVFDKAGKDAPSTREIDRIRRQFEDICSLVETADEVFKHVIGSCYIASVPVICLMLYGLIHNDLMIEEIIMLIESLVVVMTIVVVLTLTSVALNFKAHSSLTCLLKVDLSRLPHKDLQIITVFITRITTTNIGYTLYNLFTVDSSTILMVSTVVVDVSLNCGIYGL
ncbi:uncharacterized protein LOC125377575 [Haliotis rufescens]|uniref:uncharacterized protein LOC125377575 n=1 Tax=Haliotis rufescens TaxID=6454 RepID=UPI00201F131E|nr:uncharacterized protein LOC125377575 [Haliotis rufescens]